MSAVSKAEGLDFKKLAWGAQFPNTTKEFNSLREIIRSGFKDIKNFKYADFLGYQVFTDEFCMGDEKKASGLMSAICKSIGLSFADLGWK